MRRTRAYKKRNSECVIPGAMPIEDLEAYVLQEGSDEAAQIRSYVERQAPDENVKHLEKVTSESIFGQRMDAWDVRTNKNRWWVITNPTNLYSQRLFPSLDYTVSFHVGVTTRMMQAHMCEEQTHAHEHINQLWNKLARTRSTLFESKNVEDFQAVGMKCREVLLALVRVLAQPQIVPDGQESPQLGNFVKWCDLIADHLAPGSSNERLRSYLKCISKSTWELVNWLTHTRSASRFDGSIATEATENILESFFASWARSKARKPVGKVRPRRRNRE
jgi:hypothetical protein